MFQAQLGCLGRRMEELDAERSAAVERSEHLAQQLRTAETAAAEEKEELVRSYESAADELQRRVTVGVSSIHTGPRVAGCTRCGAGAAGWADRAASVPSILLRAKGRACQFDAPRAAVLLHDPEAARAAPAEEGKQEL